MIMDQQNKTAIIMDSHILQYGILDRLESRWDYLPEVLIF